MRLGRFEGLRNVSDGGWTRRYSGWFETLPRHGRTRPSIDAWLTAALMDAAQAGARRPEGYTPVRIARRSAAQVPTDTVAEPLARETEVWRVRIVEDQFLEALALPRFSIRQTPHEQPSVGAAPAWIRKSHIANSGMTNCLHESEFRRNAAMT
jgi:hypothetical protein